MEWKRQIFNVKQLTLQLKIQLMMVIRMIHVPRILSHFSYGIQQEKNQDAQQNHKVNRRLVTYSLQEARFEELLPSGRGSYW